VRAFDYDVLYVPRLDRMFPTDMPMKVRVAVRTLAIHVFVNPFAVRADHCSALYCCQLGLVLKELLDASLPVPDWVM
jgi:hypothetical protein